MFILFIFICLSWLLALLPAIRKIKKMQKSKTLKHQRQKQEGNGKSELQEIREDNIEAAKKQESKTISKHSRGK